MRLPPSIERPWSSLLCTIPTLLLTSGAIGQELRGLGALIGSEDVECLGDSGEDVHLHGARGGGLRIEHRRGAGRVVRVGKQKLCDLQPRSAHLLAVRRVLLTHLL